jgi:hypothetical protein
VIILCPLGDFDVLMRSDPVQHSAAGGMAPGRFGVVQFRKSVIKML